MAERTTPGRLVFHNGIPDCDDCQEHAFSQPMLSEACASVGIEHGKSTYEMFKTYIAAYHFRGHHD